MPHGSKANLVMIKAARWIVMGCTRWLNGWRKFRFRRQVAIHGGTLRVDSTWRFDHAARFQGRGTLYIEKDVGLGYSLAGSGPLPILLQPRERASVIRIGAGTTLVNGCELIARTSITLGAHCRIGAQSILMDSDFHGLGPQERDLPGLSAPIIIEDNVFMGIQAVVLKGVRIGKDAVVGARCVVTRDVPAGAIVVGNPMRVVGSVYGRETGG